MLKLMSIPTTYSLFSDAPATLCSYGRAGVHTVWLLFGCLSESVGPWSFITE